MTAGERSADLVVGRFLVGVRIRHRARPGRRRAGEGVAAEEVRRDLRRELTCDELRAAEAKNKKGGHRPAVPADKIDTVRTAWRATVAGWCGRPVSRRARRVSL
ncbi:putative DNA invertase/recombinase [Streptomyces sp. Tu6071]|nr:putative DNA invertase/recombinase [Streptomyces sp. Tu6071]